MDKILISESGIITNPMDDVAIIIISTFVYIKLLIKLYTPSVLPEKRHFFRRDNYDESDDSALK